MLAKHIMRRRVVTVSPQMTLREVAALFLEKQITGAPVTSVDGRLIGVISQTDLVRSHREQPAGLPSFYRPEETVIWGEGYQIQEAETAKVSDVMTPAILTADEDAPIDRVAELMLTRKVHRIVITRAGRLAGIITTMDMLRAFAKTLDKRAPALP